ncbi:MAG: uroporphyrinogen-III synthase [Nitrococcus mobilis]|nr:uroporphyrinogen-III synthase [Nitrococcus mobilis]
MQPADRDSLKNRNIVVTRPAHQAESFCRMLEHAGANVLRCPLLNISATPETPSLARLRAELASFDLLIFNSPNAVNFGLPQLDLQRNAQGRAKIAAIGAKTAHAIADLGYPVDIVPATGFDSESLLKLPIFEEVGGMKIAILRGSGGRELAGSVLRSRGAEVIYIQVYERRPPSKGQFEQIEQLLLHNRFDAIAITSGEAFLALWRGLFGPRLRHLLNQSTFVFGSSRIAGIARSEGLRSPIVVADDPSDEAMFAALLEWAAGEAPAG